MGKPPSKERGRHVLMGRLSSRSRSLSLKQFGDYPSDQSLKHVPDSCPAHVIVGQCAAVVRQQFLARRRRIHSRENVCGY
jgi:hypothetical protein